MSIVWKLHETENGIIVAMCDEELLGKILEEGDIYIDLSSYRSFYEGEKLNESKFAKLIFEKKIHSINAVGKESVEVLKKWYEIKEEEIKYVKGVPYFFVFYLR